MPEITDAEFLAAHPEHAELGQGIRDQLRMAEQLRTDLNEERQARMALEKRNAFAEAGLPASPLRDLLTEKYDGELTADAIKAYAATFDLVPSATTTKPADPSLDAARRIAGATAGAGTPPGAVEAFEDRLFGSRTAQEFDAILADAPPEIGVRGPKTVQGYRVI